MGQFWAEFLILQTLIGYCFVIANGCIGLYNIRDLNNMKGDLVLVKWHKRIGWIETFFFYVIAIQCIIMAIMGWNDYSDVYLSVQYKAGIHFLIGGIVATILFTFKFLMARYQKDTIYKYGALIGPIGFIGWSLGHWTSMVNYFFNVVPSLQTGGIYGGSNYELIFPFLPENFIVAGILPLPVGIALFLLVLLKRGSVERRGRWSDHQIAFILHGITFGYEKAAKELLGTPALYKYVVPKTYGFLEKMMEDVIGVNLSELSNLNVSDALQEFSKHAAKIGMAEKIKIKWESDREVSIESVNCSTAKVRSVMSEEELQNAICPWAIMAAAIVNQTTGKELEIEASSFNEIGAKTKLHIKE